MRNKAAVKLGKRGGEARTEAKAEAARANGAKGGRPAKIEKAALAKCLQFNLDWEKKRLIDDTERYQSDGRQVASDMLREARLAAYGKALLLQSIAEQFGITLDVPEEWRRTSGLE